MPCGIWNGHARKGRHQGRTEFGRLKSGRFAPTCWPFASALATMYATDVHLLHEHGGVMPAGVPQRTG